MNALDSSVTLTSRVAQVFVRIRLVVPLPSRGSTMEDLQMAGTAMARATPIELIEAFDSCYKGPIEEWAIRYEEWIADQLARSVAQVVDHSVKVPAKVVHAAMRNGSNASATIDAKDKYEEWTADQLARNVAVRCHEALLWLAIKSVEY